MLHLHRSFVDDQPGADGSNEILWLQTVGPQRVTRVDHVDDLVRQADQRRQLHRTVELDDVDLTALLGVVALGNVDELGGDTQAALGLDRADLAGGHQLALGNLQVQRLVQALAAVLHQHIFTGDTEVGGTMLDVSRHIGGTHDQQAYIFLGRGNDQLAALVRILGRHDARFSQKRQGIVKDAALGQCDGQHGKRQSLSRYSCPVANGAGHTSSRKRLDFNKSTGMSLCPYSRD
ncbi:hypothetical protein D9M71_531760 [compost metagenome]